MDWTEIRKEENQSKGKMKEENEGREGIVETRKKWNRKMANRLGCAHSLYALQF